MTDNEIIKALECCNRPANKTSCDDCPYQFIDEKCSSKLINDALDLINRLQSEKEALINGQETLQKHIAEQKAEIERLQSEKVTALKLTIETAKANARAETAAKIFEEGDKIVDAYLAGDIDTSEFDVRLAEVQKKYLNCDGGLTQ